MRFTPAVFALLLTSANGQIASSAKPVSDQHRRLALLIANSTYASLPPIPAASKEVALIKSALAEAGFEILALQDLSAKGFLDTHKRFIEKVQPGDVCLFYFTGYAMQGEGNNDFLLPVDFKPDLKSNLRDRAYPITLFANDLEDKAPFLKLIFLEAARLINAPIPDSAGPGLVIPDTSDVSEILIGLPDLPNRPVITSADQIGLFTQALEHQIRSTRSLPQFMPEVLKEVTNASKGQQQPSQIAKFTRSFYFHAPELQVSITGVPHQNHNDREYYSLIPAGRFRMGCVPGDQECKANEKPQHEVTISKGIWIGQNEVKVVSFRRFLSTTQGNKAKMPTGAWWDKKWNKDDHPISGMTWEQADAYCKWAGGRLPTEAEWEYAARAGKQDQIYSFTSFEDSRNKANFSGRQGNDIFDQTAPVRYFDHNDFQLFDMAGNVWEFVSDYYSPTYYENSPAVDPKGPAGGKQHVRRGGSFDSDPKKHLRISLREPSDAANNVGFRCVLDDTAEVRKLLDVPEH